jgi:hypothetical protein
MIVYLDALRASAPASRARCGRVRPYIRARVRIAGALCALRGRCERGASAWRAARAFFGRFAPVLFPTGGRSTGSKVWSAVLSAPARLDTTRHAPKHAEMWLDGGALPTRAHTCRRVGQATTAVSAKTVRVRRFAHLVSRLHVGLSAKQNCACVAKNSHAVSRREKAPRTPANPARTLAPKKRSRKNAMIPAACAVF